MEVMSWKRSSYSSSNGTNCVEVAAGWRRASYSGSNSANCVEVANLPRVVAVRDSKDPDGPRLAFTPGDWRYFTAGLKAGGLDLT
jgi:hypothetical protein